MPTNKWERLHRANIKKGIAKINAELTANANRIAEKIRILQSKQLLTSRKYGSLILKNQQLLKSISEEFYLTEGNLKEWNFTDVVYTFNTMTLKRWWTTLLKKHCCLILDFVKIN